MGPKYRVCGRAALAGLVAVVCVTMGVAAQAETPVERGSYLVNTIMTCNNCHTPMGPDGPQFDRMLSGGLLFDTPAFTVTGANITPDKETGIGDWTAAELKQTLRTGIRPNGIPLAPVMPSSFYGIISEPDMDAIVAYLHIVKPIHNEVPKPQYHLPIREEVFPGAAQKMANQGGADPIKRGFYLATIGHCMECHTPMVKGVHDWGRTGAGGMEFPGRWGISVASNITSDPDHGIGKWSDAEIKRAITRGIERDGKKLNPPMGFAYYANMTDNDLDAMIAWLRTVPPKT